MSDYSGSEKPSDVQKVIKQIVIQVSRGGGNVNQIITSHGIYMNMHPSLRKRFSELEIAPRIWKYTDEKIQSGIWKSLDKMYR